MPPPPVLTSPTHHSPTGLSCTGSMRYWRTATENNITNIEFAIVLLHWTDEYCRERCVLFDLVRKYTVMIILHTVVG